MLSGSLWEGFRKARQQSQGLRINVTDCRLESQGGRLDHFLSSDNTNLMSMNSVDTTMGPDDLVFTRKYAGQAVPKNRGMRTNAIKKCHSTPMLNSNVQNAKLHNLPNRDNDRYWNPSSEKGKSSPARRQKKPPSPLRSHRSQHSRRPDSGQRTPPKVDSATTREAMKSPMIAKSKEAVNTFNASCRPQLSPKQGDREAWREYYAQRAAKFLARVKSSVD